jgi:activating signal cointegrator complex subunit 2
MAADLRAYRLGGRTDRRVQNHARSRRTSKLSPYYTKCASPFSKLLFRFSPQPKLKEKVLARHEFSGNRPLAGLSSSRPSAHSSRSRSRTPDPQPARGRGEGGRGRRGQTRDHGPGRGRGRSRGRGRGETTGPETRDGGDARSRASKDKNKARQANHDRKRGHDKKMAKAGGPS